MKDASSTSPLYIRDSPRIIEGPSNIANSSVDDNCINYVGSGLGAGTLLRTSIKVVCSQERFTIEISVLAITMAKMQNREKQLCVHIQINLVYRTTRTTAFSATDVPSLTQFPDQFDETQ